MGKIHLFTGLNSVWTCKNVAVYLQERPAAAGL